MAYAPDRCLGTYCLAFRGFLGAGASSAGSPSPSRLWRLRAAGGQPSVETRVGWSNISWVVASHLLRSAFSGLLSTSHIVSLLPRVVVGPQMDARKSMGMLS